LNKFGGFTLFNFNFIKLVYKDIFYIEIIFKINTLVI